MLDVLEGAVGVRCFGGGSWCKRFWRGQLVLDVLEGAAGVRCFGEGSWC